MQFPPWLKSVHHDGSAKYVSTLYPRLGESVTLRIRSAAHAPIRELYLRTFPDGEQALTPMTRISTTPPCQWWEVSLPIAEPVTNYRFLIQADGGLWTYTAAGPAAYLPLDVTDFRILAGYEAPEWVHAAVFYQIFPDRFANGDPANDPQADEFDFRGFGPQTYPWGTPPAPEQPFPLVFYGGDLPGIVQHLDYLDQLGVTALYLNPIFTSHSNHKYDVIDYDHVDPHFGGDKALAELREALSARSMRYILDIVPNHCGYWHPWFQRALAEQTAEESEFFTFNSHPHEYASWLGVWTLPKLNYRSLRLRQRIYEDADAVFRRWLRPPYAADGWRVDVANMLGRQGPTQLGADVARGIRMAVKATRPSAYLMGENFFDATPQLQGDQFDGIMNYAGLSQPLQYWLDAYREYAHSLKRHISVEEPWPTTAMVETWRSRLAAIPWAVALQQFNLLGSHDTPRIRSVLNGNDALQRLAAIVQFTFPGVPCVYYGDEIGLEDDPMLKSRGCMPWDEAGWNRPLLAFYRRLIEVRRGTPVLQRGGLQILAVEEDSFAYQREDHDSWALVVGHRALAARQAWALPVAHGGIPDGTRFTEVFSGQTLTVADGTVNLPPQPQGATLWLSTP